MKKQYIKPEINLSRNGSLEGVFAYMGFTQDPAFACIPCQPSKPSKPSGSGMKKSSCGYKPQYPWFKWW